MDTTLVDVALRDVKINKGWVQERVAGCDQERPQSREHAFAREAPLLLQTRL
jgi:hypothetical protein